jgi:hypothetical protein
LRLWSSSNEILEPDAREPALDHLQRRRLLGDEQHALPAREAFGDDVS